MKLHKIARQLQLALCKRGRRVKINHVQFFSESTGRPKTLYVAVEVEKLPNGRIKNTEICTSSMMADVVKALAGMLNSMDGGE